MATRPLALIAAALAVGTLAAQSATAARFQFCWIGANGYTMEGQVAFADELLGTGIITEDQITGFWIQGFRDGVPVGFWSLDALTPETSWTVFFDTNTLQFPMGGSRVLQSYQEWNASGEVNDCGAVGGFGFNGGNWAQDVCIDNVWIEDSSIDPYTPLQAHPMAVRLACDVTLPIS